MLDALGVDAPTTPCSRAGPSCRARAIRRRSPTPRATLGVPPERVHVVDRVADAVDAAIASTPADGQIDRHRLALRRRSGSRAPRPGSFRSL